MLVQDIEVICIKNLNIPFTYLPISKPFKTYIKDYNIAKPLYISSDKLIPIKFNSKGTIIIVYKNRFYWCLQFEELYKSYKGSLSVQNLLRNAFVSRTTIKLDSIPPLLSFDFRSVSYQTRDLKQIIIKDANN